MPERLSRKRHGSRDLAMVRERMVLLTVVGVFACVVLAGCRNGKWAWSKDKAGSAEAAELQMPPHIDGTVAEYAAFAGGGDLPVRGFGVVVGLGTNGSSEVSPRLMKYLKQYLARQRLGSSVYGTEPLTPTRFLQDPDTSAVEIYGSIPPGAPKGTTFDVFVRTLPQSQTTSLDGGILMSADLAVSRGPLTEPDAVLNVWARAGGAIFLNPFIKSDSPAELAQLRAGRVLGGGVVTRDRPVLLQLRRSDYQQADLIQKRVNERFSGRGRRKKVANAKNSSIVELNIPDEHRADYEHFLKLVIHLPIQGAPGGWEARARRLIEAMDSPGALYDDLALVLEAMGRQMVPILRSAYTAENPYKAYFAARTGLRLGDHAATEIVVRFAKTANSPLQTLAIAELGRGKRTAAAVTTLHGLVDDDNELVRLAAYEALNELGDRTVISRVRIPKQFTMDLVDSKRSYVIYATQTQQPRIVLFGKNMQVARPVFFNARDDTVILNARKDDKELVVFRKIPRSGAYSDEFRIGFNVSLLVTTLGNLPEHDDDGQIKGLGLTYGQIVSAVSRMCEEGDIPSRFVLQEMPSVQKIYESATTVGRPDTPE